MASYVFIASHDPERSVESPQLFDLAEGLARAHDRVTVYLTSSAVTASKRWLAPLLAARVLVLADPGALKERGIAKNNLVKGVVPVPFETLVAQWAA